MASVKKAPVPARCVCGKVPITVCIRGGKMLTYPDPLHCSGNIRTRWVKDIDTATIEWNALVSNRRQKERKS